MATDTPIIAWRPPKGLLAQLDEKVELIRKERNLAGSGRPIDLNKILNAAVMAFTLMPLTEQQKWLRAYAREGYYHASETATSVPAPPLTEFQKNEPFATPA